MQRKKDGKRRPKLLFVVTEDWYFLSHRLPLALAALSEGMDVAVATNVVEHEKMIRDLGIELHRWQINRGSTSLLSELKSVFSLACIYRRVQPDIVHQVAIKPVLYGSLVARFICRPKLINALGGMGALFSDQDGKKSILRSIVLAGFRWLLSGRDNVLILQNTDDRDLLLDACSLDKQAIHLIRGAGVDTNVFCVAPEPDGIPVVVLPARMLADKGVFEFVAAARQLKAQGVNARFVLVGGNDECNPANIPVKQLNAWVDEGSVEWLGRRNDMPEILAGATVVCLPSYREGLPKALLEAAASGRAIVTTDVPGCREIVRHTENGLLVPPRDAERLAAAILSLLSDSHGRHRMGARGRELVLSDFSEARVVRDTVKIYWASLAKCGQQWSSIEGAAQKANH